MMFSDLKFLFIFAPIMFVLYYLSPQKVRIPCLLLGSLAFYVWGVIILQQPLYYIPLFLLSSVVNWLLGLLIDRGIKSRRFWLIIGLIYNFGWLFLFKYADFFLGTAESAIHRFWPLADIDLPLLEWALPIGISFYTFQIVSYLVDVYRKDIEAERSLIRVATYLYSFPRLSMGPIITYSRVSEHLRKPAVSLELFNDGLKEFTIGLGLKVLLADRLFPLWDTIVNTYAFDISTLLAWMGIVAYCMYIYFEFYGASLMAIGLGRMLGFDLPANFRHPYMAKSVTDFWRRWHITLGAWFRDYVYIPLGGNRVNVPRHMFNMLVVWLFTGFWHGANWNFLLWGLFFFVLLVIEKYLTRNALERVPILGHAYMALVIPLSFLIFELSDLHQIAVYLERLFPFLPGEAAYVAEGDWLLALPAYGIPLLVGLIFCTSWPRRLYDRMKDTIWGSLLLLAIFWGSVYFLYIMRDATNPFKYAGF